MKHAVGALVGAVLVVMLARIDDVEALSNPLNGGRNIVVKATTTFKKVPASGTRCSITFVNTNNEVLCTGYAVPMPGDGGVNGQGFTMRDGGVTCATSMDVCASGCPYVNWLTRDANPDNLWYAAKTLSADGGTVVRIEMGTGCLP